MSHYSSRKWGEEEVGAYFKFRPGGLRLFDGGGGGVGGDNSKIYGIRFYKVTMCQCA